MFLFPGPRSSFHGIEHGTGVVNQVRTTILPCWLFLRGAIPFLGTQPMSGATLGLRPLRDII